MELPLPCTRTVTITKVVTRWDCFAKCNRCKTNHRSFNSALNCPKRNSEPYEIFINDERRQNRNAAIFGKVVMAGETLTSVGNEYDLSASQVRYIIDRRIASRRLRFSGLKKIREAYKNSDVVDAGIMSSYCDWFSSRRCNEHWNMDMAHKKLAFIGIY